LGFTHVNVGDLIQQHKCYEGHDDELDTNILDEDKLLDVLEPILGGDDDDEDENDGADGDRTDKIAGKVADFHICEIFPERWFDLVLVLRANTEVLFDRLTARDYSEKKRSENMECEIMQVILEAAKEAYDTSIVHEVPSNTIEDMESNVQRVAEWSKQWINDNNTAT